MGAGELEEEEEEASEGASTSAAMEVNSSGVGEGVPILSIGFTDSLLLSRPIDEVLDARLEDCFNSTADLASCEVVGTANALVLLSTMGSA